MPTLHASSPPRQGQERFSDPLRLLILTRSKDDACQVLEALQEAGIPAEAVWHRELAGGLDALQGEPFDVILLEPDPEAIAQVSALAPQAPVVLLVSRDDMVRAVRALGHGADDYLVREEITSGLLIVTLRHALALKRAEMMLRRTDSMWREIVGNLREGVMVVDREGVTLFSTTRVADILGYAAEELPGTAFTSFVDPEDASLAETLLRRGRGRKEAELRLQRSDGEVVGARLTAFPAGDGTAVIVDAEERPGEEEIRQRATRLYVINQVVKAATSSADMEELLTGVLGKTLSLLRFEGGGVYLIDPCRSRAELIAEIGLPAGFSFRQQIAEMNTPPYDMVLGQGVPHFVEDYPRCYPEDAGSGIQAFASVPITAEGQVIGAVNLISRNVHAFSPDERELLTSIGREIGSAINRMRLHEQANFYLDIMSHDINNANTAAIGYASLLAESLSGPEKDLARKIMAAVRQSAETIGNVSTIRRITEETPVLGPVRLDPVITNAICLFSDVEVCYVPQDRWVVADDLLSAVFVNLIGNAVKFGGPGVSVQISVREEDETLLVSVEDTGPGIPDSEKPLIFEKFRKRGAKSGKGIGLYITRTLIERYGGRIWVEDRVPGDPERGAAFRFTLPRSCPPITGRSN